MSQPQITLPLNLTRDLVVRQLPTSSRTACPFCERIAPCAEIVVEAGGPPVPMCGSCILRAVAIYAASRANLGGAELSDLHPDTTTLPAEPDPRGVIPLAALHGRDDDGLPCECPACRAMRKATS